MKKTIIDIIVNNIGIDTMLACGLIATQHSDAVIEITLSTGDEDPEDYDYALGMGGIMNWDNTFDNWGDERYSILGLVSGKFISEERREMTPIGNLIDGLNLLAMSNGPGQFYTPELSEDVLQSLVTIFAVNPNKVIHTVKSIMEVILERSKNIDDNFEEYMSLVKVSRQSSGDGCNKIISVPSLKITVGDLTPTNARYLRNRLIEENHKPNFVIQYHPDGEMSVNVLTPESCDLVDLKEDTKTEIKDFYMRNRTESESPKHIIKTKHLFTQELLNRKFDQQ